MKCGGGGGGGGKTIEMRRGRENNKNEGKYENCGAGKRIEEGNVIKKDSLLSLTISIDFF